MRGDIPRFILAGGTAALVNWLARIALSLAMPFIPAVILAAIIGMVAGFLLYRTFVWPAQGRSWQAQLTPFILVNLAGWAIVLGAALVLLAGGEALFGKSPVVAALAHGSGIALGALVYYLGHRRITLAPLTQRA